MLRSGRDNRHTTKHYGKQNSTMRVSQRIPEIPRWKPLVLNPIEKGERNTHRVVRFHAELYPGLRVTDFAGSEVINPAPQRSICQRWQDD